MNSEERLNRIEKILEANSRQLGSVVQESDKHNDAISKLIVVARTCLDSIKDMRESHEADYRNLLEAQAATDEKLNILVHTVDRIIRRENHP
jgi:hypothetical protein